MLSSRSAAGVGAGTRGGMAEVPLYRPSSRHQATAGHLQLAPQRRSPSVNYEPPSTESAYDTIKRFLVMEDALRKLSKRSTSSASVRRPASDELTRRPASDELTRRPASDELTRRPVADELTRRPASDELTRRPASDELTRRPASDELTRRPAADEFTRRPAADELTRQLDDLQRSNT